MNLQDLTLQQLKEIVDGAPEGAEHVNLTPRYRSWTFDEWNDFTSADPRIVKNTVDINDLRNRITELEPVFKVGDWIVLTGLDQTPDTMKLGEMDFNSGFVDCTDIYRLATPAEIAAGHRIDEPNDFDAMSVSHRSPCCKCHEFPIDAEFGNYPENQQDKILDFSRGKINF